MVIIDMPAQLSTAAVNALCAATHVLVPSILDMATLQVTCENLGMIRDLRKALGLNFRFLGVLPSMVASGKGYAPREHKALMALRQELKGRFARLLVPGTKTSEPLGVLNVWLAHKGALRQQPGQDLPFFTSADAELTGMFDNLRREIEGQLLAQGFALAYLERQSAHSMPIAAEKEAASAMSVPQRAFPQTASHSAPIYVENPALAGAAAFSVVQPMGSKPARQPGERLSVPAAEIAPLTTPIPDDDMLALKRAMLAEPEPRKKAS